MGLGPLEICIILLVIAATFGGVRAGMKGMNNSSSGVVSNTGGTSQTSPQESGALMSTVPGPSQTKVTNSQMRSGSVGSRGSRGSSGSYGGSSGSYGTRGSAGSYGGGSAGSYGMRGSAGNSAGRGSSAGAGVRQNSTGSFVIPVYRPGSRDFWVCSYCESINENANTTCKVCGFGR